MRFLSYLSMLLLAATLTACGGGGGSAGVTSGALPATLTTTAPSSLTIAVGASQTYTIIGGKSPYTISSSNQQVSIAGAKDNALTIGGIAPGAASITVTDAEARTTVISVTVANLAPFATNAPAALTVVQGTRNSYTLSGGVPGYSAVSGDSRFVTVTVNGSILNISAVAITTAPVQVLVRDGAGAVLTIAVTVSSSSTIDVFTDAPAALSVSQKSTTTFTVGGGTLPYSVVTSNSSAAVANLNGTVLTITSFAPSTGGAGNVATITVRDANGKIAMPIVVSVTTLPFVLSATDISAFVGMDIVVNISGGTPPYRVLSGLSAAVTATLLPSQTDFLLSLILPSDVEISVLDANNQQLKLKVKVIAGSPSLGLSPTAITVAESDTRDILLTLTGAAPGAVSVFSSDTTKLQASIAGNIVTVRTGSSRCVAADTAVNITVIDSKGAFGTATITIKDNGNVPPVVGPPAVPGSNCPP